MPAKSVALRRAIKASAKQLAVNIPETSVFDNTAFHFKPLTAKELRSKEREAIWKLIDRNMRDIASSSSMGWDPPAKKKELFHREARFILVYQTTGESGTTEEREAIWDAECIAAFAMFRFEEECDEDVLYCYELQLSETVRRCGLGRFLMHRLVDIGIEWKMTKVMLTVLKANQGALLFYQKLGFTMDPTSPGYIEEGDAPDPEEEDCDYEILSIPL